MRAKGVAGHSDGIAAVAMVNGGHHTTSASIALAVITAVVATLALLPNVN